MLVNSGELDGARILSPTTVDLMASNHLPDGVARGAAGGEASGEGYGLGVRVVTDAAKAGNLTSAKRGKIDWNLMMLVSLVIRHERFVAPPSTSPP